MTEDGAPLLDGIGDVSQIDGEGPMVSVLNWLCRFDFQVRDLLFRRSELTEERKQSSR